MTPSVKILLEGSYIYYQNDVNYAQEEFKLVQLTEAQSYHIYSEILSRMENGEFLKILVRYEMNQFFIPLFVRIEKSIGNKYAQETFKMDPSTFELHYTFNNSHTVQEFKKNISAKHYLTSPAVATSAIFTLSKKFDTSGRVAVVLVGSENEWTYAGPPTDKMVYAEFKTREMEDFKIHGNSLSASHYSLYESDSIHSGAEDPVELYLSKHFNIPYQLQHGSLKVVIKNLRRND